MTLYGWLKWLKATLPNLYFYVYNANPGKFGFTVFPSNRLCIYLLGLLHYPKISRGRENLEDQYVPIDMNS